MRILVVAWDNGGGVEVTEAVVGKCVRAGHDVRVLGTEGLRKRIESTGATFIRYRHAPDNDRSRPETDIVKDWETSNPLEAFARIRDRVTFGPAALFCRDVTEELERGPADLVLVDVLIAPAACAAEAAGVPRALFMHALYGIPRAGSTPMGAGFEPQTGTLGRVRDRAVTRLAAGLLKSGLAPLNAARAGLGLAPYASPVELFDGVDRIVVCTSPSYDFNAATASDNTVYVGPQADDGEPGPWDDPRPEGSTRPLVLVGLSSTFMSQVDLLQAAADALGRLDVHGLITTGPSVDPASVHPPANVTVVPWARHADVVRHCAAVVTHGGHGTVMKALEAGVPLVVVPLGRDQPDNAARVVHVGAGIRVKGKPDADKLEAALRSVLDDPSYRAAAGRVAARLTEERDDGLVVRELEATAAGEPPRPRPTTLALPRLALPDDLGHRTVEVSDGGRIEVLERPGTGPTVVFLHGMTLTAETWVKQFDGLDPDFRLLAWNQRGSGASTVGTDGVGIDRLAEDLVEVLEALDVHRGLVVGHSLGGMVVIEAAITRGDRLAARADGLMTVATTGGTEPAEGAGAFKTAFFGTIRSAEEKWHVFSRLPGALALSTRTSFGPERPGRAERDLVRHMLVEESPKIQTDLVDLLSTYDSRGRLDAVGLPVTVVAGARDNYLPVGHAERFAGSLPQATFEPIPRAGHLLMLERPALFDAIVTRAATRPDGGGGGGSGDPDPADD